jgi:copper(I)-binding protein
MSGGKPVANITVPAYGSVELKPGAAFVRLSELKRDVKAGDQLTVTVETDGGLAIAIAATVK